VSYLAVVAVGLGLLLLGERRGRPLPVIVGKSMLLDMRRGQQLANECTL
jgi:hypothetical protein